MYLRITDHKNMVILTTVRTHISNKLVGERVLDCVMRRAVAGHLLQDVRYEETKEADDHNVDGVRLAFCTAATKGLLFIP
jgi:hypothetical protein